MPVFGLIGVTFLATYVRASPSLLQTASALKNAPSQLEEQLSLLQYGGNSASSRVVMPVQTQQWMVPDASPTQAGLEMEQLSSQTRYAMGLAEKMAKREDIQEKVDDGLRREMVQLAENVAKVAELARSSAKRENQLEEQLRVMNLTRKSFEASQERMVQHEKELVLQAQRQLQQTQEAQRQLQQQVNVAMQQKQQAQELAFNEAQALTQTQMQASSAKVHAQTAEQQAAQSAQYVSAVTNALAHTAAILQNVASLASNPSMQPAAAAPMAFPQSLPRQGGPQQQQTELEQHARLVQQPPLQQLALEQTELQHQPQFTANYQVQMGYPLASASLNPAAIPAQAPAWDLRRAAFPTATVPLQQQAMSPEALVQMSASPSDPSGSSSFMNWLRIR